MSINQKENQSFIAKYFYTHKEFVLQELPLEKESTDIVKTYIGITCTIK